MAYPADRFRTAASRDEDRAGDRAAAAAAARRPRPRPLARPGRPTLRRSEPPRRGPVDRRGQPVGRVARSSSTGSCRPAGTCGWPASSSGSAPARAGVTVTFWADTDVIHLLIAGARIKTVRSHLSVTDLAALAANGGRTAGPSPLPPPEPGDAVEVDRTVSRTGTVSLGQHIVLAAEILAGRRVSIRIEQTTLMFFDPDTRELLRTRPNPLTPDRGRQAARRPPRRAATPAVDRTGPGAAAGVQHRRRHGRRTEGRPRPGPRTRP